EGARGFRPPRTPGLLPPLVGVPPPPPAARGGREGQHLHDAPYPRARSRLPPGGGEFAISTFSVRPSTTCPLNFFAAASASSAFIISTKPNPRERPLSRSVTTVAASMPPP